MDIQQFYIQLYIEQKGVNDLGEEHNYLRCIQVDLLRDDLATFLREVPKDLTARSCLCVTITRNDGEVIAYADGMWIDDVGTGVRSFKHIHSDSAVADAIRENAKLFARRRFKRTMRHENASTE